MELLFLVISGAFLGGAVETLAYSMKWWEFSVPGFIFLQVIFVEGLAMGTLAWAIKENTPSTRYILSACAGGMLEALNAAWFELWSFPGDSFLFIKGKVWIVIAMTLVWGFFCPLVIVIGKRLQGWWEEQHPF